MIAPVIEIQDLRDGYSDLVRYVRDHGTFTAPRGKGTYEIRGATVVLRDPTDAVPVGVGRKLNLDISSLETTHLIAGLSDGRQVIDVAPAFKSFTDDGVRFDGAYGPRTYFQLDSIVQKLADDQDSRQAVVTLWRGDELDNPSLDVPCTLTFQFLIRDGRLDMITSMRSNDVWLGVAYDFTMFTRLQLTLAWALGVPVGVYVHQAGSLHLYESNVADVDALHAADRDCGEYDVPAYMRVGADTRPGARTAAQALVRLNNARLWARAVSLDLTTKTDVPEHIEATHGKRLRSHATDGLMCSICRYVLPPTTEYFYAAHLHSGKRRRSQCKRCVLGRVQQRYSTEDARLARRLATYGVNVAWYVATLAAQNGVCAICQQIPDNGRYQDFVVDHDHETGRVRGLLCNNCNHGLGMFGDDAGRVAAAARYLT